MISKHIIRSIFSLAVLLFAASCQKDPDGSAPDGNNLTLQVLLPVEGGTKATDLSTKREKTPAPITNASCRSME